MIESAEVSGNVSSRDGLLMKRLPEGSRFGHQGLMQYLQVRESRKHRAIHLLTHRRTCQDAIVGNEALVRLPMSAHFGSALAPTHGTRGRHVLYALRSMALIKAMKPALALKASFCGAVDGDVWHIRKRVLIVRRIAGRVCRIGIRRW